MRARNREINVFNLSMLDVISGAMAAFLIIMVVLMPYYRKTHIDYQSMINTLREQLVSALEQSATATARAEAAQATAAAAREQASAAQAQVDALQRRELDLMIVIDTTSSMHDEIASLQASLKDLVGILEALTKTLRVGVIAYRDTDTADYVTQTFPLTIIDGAGRTQLGRRIDGLTTAGGQTWEEAVYEGLAAAVEQPWRASAEGVIVVIGDARAHADKVQATYALAARFRARSNRYRVSAISARVEDSAPPQQLREWNAGEPDRAFFAELARQGGGVNIPSTGPLLSGIVASIFQ